MESTESRPGRTAPNTLQALAALRKEVYQKSAEVDRLASALASIQPKVDHVLKAYRRLLGSIMALAAILMGIFIGLLATTLD